MENKTITKDDFCKLYNDMNGEVKVAPEDLATPERAPMNEKEKLPEYKNCDCKSVDVALKENGESVDNGPIAVLSMATLIRWIGEGRCCANQKLSAKDLAAAGLMADGVRYIIVHDDAKYPYSLTISDTRECKIWYSMNEDESSALVLENAGIFFFSRPFENEAEKLKKESDLKKMITKEMLDGANQPVDERSVEPLQPLSQSDAESDVSETENSVVASAVSGENGAGKRGIAKNDDLDTVITVFAFNKNSTYLRRGGSFSFMDGKDNDLWDYIFNGVKGASTKNFAIVCPDKNGQFEFTGFIEKRGTALDCIGAAKDGSYNDCDWLTVLFKHKDVIFGEKPTKIIVFCDHKLKFDIKDEVGDCADKVNINVIYFGDEGNVPDAEYDSVKVERAIPCIIARASISQAFKNILLKNNQKTED